MGLNWNKVNIAGNLTRDVEVKYLQNGMAVAEIGVAVNRRWKDNNGESREEVDFIDVTIFGRSAEVCGEYCSKGSNVFIEGRLKLDQWEKDGQKRSKLKVICENFKMIGSKQDGQQSGGDRPQQGRQQSGGRQPQQRQQTQQRHQPPGPDDDVPWETP